MLTLELVPLPEFSTRGRCKGTASGPPSLLQDEVPVFGRPTWT